MTITSTNPITLSLAAAIALANGYNVTGSIPNNTNNPGLLQNGDVGFGVDSQGHTVYGTPEMGIIALQAQAKHILNGDSKTFSYGPNWTPLSVIGAILAPNDATWVKNVATALGVPPATTLGAIASGSVPVPAAFQILPTNKLTMQGDLPGQPQYFPPDPPNLPSLDPPSPFYGEGTGQEFQPAPSFPPPSPFFGTDLDVNAYTPTSTEPPPATTPGAAGLAVFQQQLSAPAPETTPTLPTASTGGQGTGNSGLGFNPIAAVPLAPTTLSVATAGAVNAVSSNLEINDNTMSQTPWYQDTNLITGNQRVRNSMGKTDNSGLVLPVSFRVYLSKAKDSLLINPTTQQPITINLNASLTQWSLLSKHVFNRQRTRTGMHITFWGMAADIIQGTASTGVFMNAFGATDYFSTAIPTPDMLDTVRRAFAKDPAAIQQVAENPEAYRVAAQDAFVEFLKLFQMNGNVWFTSTPASPTQANQSQTAPNVWQVSTGASSSQQNAKNNDVRSRGYVVMAFRNNLYLGYFKTLQWTMDAEKPFQWTFNFTFQVEKTLTAYYYPFASAAPTITNVPLNTRQTPLSMLPSSAPPGPSTAGPVPTTTSTLPNQIT